MQGDRDSQDPRDSRADGDGADLNYEEEAMCVKAAQARIDLETLLGEPKE